jgi:hypothetical protein
VPAADYAVELVITGARVGGRRLADNSVGPKPNENAAPWMPVPEPEARSTVTGHGGLAPLRHYGRCAPALHHGEASAGQRAPDELPFAQAQARWPQLADRLRLMDGR